MSGILFLVETKLLLRELARELRREGLHRLLCAEPPPGSERTSIVSRWRRMILRL
jgi:hypothetical protein